MDTAILCYPPGHLGQIYRSWLTPATCQRAGSCAALRGIIEYTWDLLSNAYKELLNQRAMNIRTLMYFGFH